MTQEGWQARLTQTVAAQVRRYRGDRKMSAQMLSDRCGELGFPIPRPVLSNLENGRRESVTLAEILVLAAALSVPPVELVVPVGFGIEIEILPDLIVPSWDAAKWIDGDGHPAIKIDSTGSRLTFDGEPTISDHYRAHEASVKSWRLLLDRMAEKVASGDEGSARTFEAAATNSVGHIAAVRHRMHDLGLLIPPVPPELEASLPSPEEPAAFPD